ncbi:ISL3 family transposase [Leuconostoc citreum]|nr:ISL3 family transposase [Leuconostoc citreum]MCT3076919.1 ISL3 family transposase [Leuconostoc citreum]
MVPKWLLIKGHVAHSSFKTIESESKNFYARNVDTRPLRTSLTFNQTTISTQTVMRAAEGLFVYNKTNFHYLPQNIAFDDFKSGKFATSGMSMILIDSVNHRILDVMKDRGAGQLRAYFNQYSPAARAAVKTITVDLFTPYRAMIKDLFPNANIVADRFHVVTQAYRELNKVRISVMKKFGSDSKEYRQLKRFWKLLMKHETALDYTTRKNRINFKHAYLTDKEVIDRLLALSDELRDAYAFYQGILYAIETRDEAELKSVLYPTKNDAQYRSLPKAMKKARRTIRKHFDEIINSFIYGFSNGPIEGSNNKIKAIKRTA